MSLKIYAFALAMAILSSGCAYHVGSGDRGIPGGYKQIAVPVFKNATQEAGIEVYFTNAFIRELERSRIGRISSKADAQVVLEGNVDSVRYVAVNQNTDVSGGFIVNTEYRIFLTATLILRRISDQKVLWQASFEKEGTYLAPTIRSEGLNSANALYNHSARYQNIQLLAGDMMAEAHDRLTENF